MNTKKRLLQAGTPLAVVVGLVAGGSVAANATTAYPEGGTWKYGIREYSSTVYAYSEYFQPTRIHKASVQSSTGSWGYSGWVTSNVWAKAPEQATGWTGAHYWYDLI